MDATGPDIRCLNVKYSPNLGDGLLSECLENALRKRGAGAGTRSVDLAGRGAYGDGMRGRGAILAGLDLLPAGLRGVAVRPALAVQARRRWVPHYRAGLEGADAVIVGGGNLLADLDLNFPTKIGLALREAGRRGLPLAIFGCGMGGGWSGEGLRRMRAGLRAVDLRSVALRDAASAARWDAAFGAVTGVVARVVRDPGLMAARTWNAPARNPRRIGLGVMSHVAIRYHATAAIDADALRSWYLDLARALTARGVEVVAFTNGAPEDVAAARALLPALTAMGVDVVTPDRPEGLARLVAGCGAIAAYRMHAVIAAHSYGVPALALAWDDKLAAFMASVGREDWLRDPARLGAEEAVGMLTDAAHRGLDDRAVAAVIDEAEADVAQVLADLA